MAPTAPTATKVAPNTNAKIDTCMGCQHVLTTLVDAKLATDVKLDNCGSEETVAVAKKAPRKRQFVKVYEQNQMVNFNGMDPVCSAGPIQEMEACFVSTARAAKKCLMDKKTRTAECLATVTTSRDECLAQGKLVKPYQMQNMKCQHVGEMVKQICLLTKILNVKKSERTQMVVQCMSTQIDAVVNCQSGQTKVQSEIKNLCNKTTKEFHAMDEASQAKAKQFCAALNVPEEVVQTKDDAKKQMKSLCQGSYDNKIAKCRSALDKELEGLVKKALDEADATADKSKLAGADGHKTCFENAPTAL